MRLLPSDPDVETIVSRVENGDLDLQPDFQRGEVWPRSKKQRLVDSILRDWHVPPIHVIELAGTRRQEVLDGQQRLVAIRDFCRNDFSVDGNAEPTDIKIQELDGMKYRDLPDAVRRQFNQFTIRVFRIVDYQLEEPAELFFRLNQPTNLTSAEQRNAFFGPVRTQIKDLVQALEDHELDKTFIGFSNSRMAYDDVISRVALTIERRSIVEKINASDLVARYRSESPIPELAEEAILWSIALLSAARTSRVTPPKFNKASLYSWLVFLVRGYLDGQRRDQLSNDFASFLGFFHDETVEWVRELERRAIDSIFWLYKNYEDRSASRVADVSSVVLRDLAIWFSYAKFSVLRNRASSLREALPDRLRHLQSVIETEEADMVAKAAIDANWGQLP